MNFGRRKFIIKLIAAVLCLLSKTVSAFFFEPGIGTGVEYTNNVTLINENNFSDLIAVGYVGGHLSEDEGALIYDATATYNYQSYTQSTYPDQQYFNLGARVNWEMVKERFNWFLSDNYSQRTINTLDSNTPDNLQNNNVFAFGADINLPVSQRHTFSILPVYRQYYYENSPTNNKQYAISADWIYQMFRSSSIGLSLSTRYIDYTEQVIANTRFTNLVAVLSGLRKRSKYTVNLGSTNVTRDTGEETTGFSGYLNWFAGISTHSSLTTILSTDLTDTSSVSKSAVDIPGSGDNIQVTTDVIRISGASLTYNREDDRLSSQIGWGYREINYSDRPLDRVIRTFGLTASYPLTALLSSGAYANYNRTKQLVSGRLDRRITVGGNLRYNFSRKVHGLLDLKYRDNVSTDDVQNYNELSVFANLVYGFGDAGRPTRAGGF